MENTAQTQKDINDIDARELYAAFERGVPGAKEAYEKLRARRDEIKRGSKRRWR